MAEMKKVNLYGENSYPSGYPNQTKSRSYLLAILTESYNYFLLYLGFFRVK